MVRWGGCSKREASGRGRRTLCAAAVALMALVLGLSVVAVGCSDSVTEPEKAVQSFLTALENEDMEAFVELTLSAEDLALAEAAGMDATAMMGMMLDALPWDSIKFSDVTMKTSEMTDDEAVVTVTGGTVEMTVDGVTETKEATDSDVPLVFNLYKAGDKWLIDFDSM